jgi:nucleotide-binding universal stress UspA family protein
MKRFKNILFLQGKNEAKTPLLRALNLAQRNRAKLKVVDVFETLPEKIDSQLREKYGLDLKAVTQRELEERIKRLVPTDRRKASRLTVLPLFGIPFIEIIREVARGKHDLVITGTEESGGLKQRLFGSTTMHLMRKCPCPVWVIKPARKRTFTAIMAAVDVMGAGNEEDELNKKIMELSSSMAEMEGSKLHIVHCWSQPIEGASKRYSGLTNERIAEIVDETLKLHQRSFLEFLERFDPQKVSYQTHLLKGEPGDVIADYANKKKIDLLVMGTVSRAGISGLLMGNTAERVLSDIQASVLTVKPDEFQTPVK